jgi:hypothetical protein
MASKAKQHFDIAITNAALLCLRGSALMVTRQHRQVQYHAALAASVGSWEAYLESVSREFLSEIADPLDIRFTALQQLLIPRLEEALKRFNTPNAKNSRELLFNFTGYDPINDWNWPRRRLGGIAVRTRIDEVLQVRHSFAHGYSMPAYGWNSDPAGNPRLTAACLSMVASLFSHLTAVTDRGLDQHIGVAYGRTRVWY